MGSRTQAALPVALFPEGPLGVPHPVATPPDLMQNAFVKSLGISGAKGGGKCKEISHSASSSPAASVHLWGGGATPHGRGGGRTMTMTMTMEPAKQGPAPCCTNRPALPTRPASPRSSPTVCRANTACAGSAGRYPARQGIRGLWGLCWGSFGSSTRGFRFCLSPQRCVFPERTAGRQPSGSGVLLSVAS